MVLCTALFVAVMASRYEDQVYQEMEETAVYVKRGMEESGGDYLSGLEDLEGGQRLTWIAADGTVLYDSEADPAAMENHADREEVIQALEEGTGQSKHLSNTLLQKTLYYAVRLDNGTVLRLSCQGDHHGRPDNQCLAAHSLDCGTGPGPLWGAGLSAVPADHQAHQQHRPGKPPAGRRLRGALPPGGAPAGAEPHHQPADGGPQPPAQGVCRPGGEHERGCPALLDSRYNILYSNQSAYALLGGEEEKPESLRQETCRKEIWGGGRPGPGRRHAESLMRAESHIFEILANPVTANGQVTGVVVLMVDVTEREERESLRRSFPPTYPTS